jgi:hypothetical protein
MISEQSLTTNLTTLLGHPPQRLDIQALAARLNEASSEHAIELSSYGYIMHVIEKYGMQGIYKGMLGTKDSISSYTQEARNYRDSMMELLVNASSYAKNVFSQVTDPDICMKRLEEMSFPYVLYVLFCGLGQAEQVEQFREEAEEHFRRYPSTADKLTPKFRNVVEEFLSHESAE